MKITNATKLPIFQKATKVLLAHNKPQHDKALIKYFDLLEKEVMDMTSKSNEVASSGILGVWVALKCELHNQRYSV